MSHRLPALVLGSLAAVTAFAVASGSLGPEPVDLAEASPGPTGAASLASPSTPPASEAPPAARWTPRPVPPPAPLSLIPRLDEAFQASIDDAQEATGIPGISATVVFPDGRRWTGTSGFADVAARTPVTEDTAFSVASITKTFTAALVLDLVEEGQLALDEPVAVHLPELELDPAITVSHLLDHTSGLRDFFDRELDRELLAAPSTVWAPERVLDYVGKPYFAAGRGWQYSNTNYLLLGLLAERITGDDLAELYRSRFFDPLRLETAFSQEREAPRGPVARGYRFSGASPAERPIEVSDGSDIVPFTSVITASGGAGIIAASSSDVARWAWHLYRDEVLEPGTVDRILADVELVKALRPRIPYGLGMQVLTLERHLTLGHSGRFLGFRSVVRYLPEQGVAIAVLTNQSRTDPAWILRRLIRVMLPEPLPCRSCHRVI